MSLLRIFNNGKSGKIILNLTKISSVDLTDRIISFTLSHEKKPITGGFLFFSGGNSKDINMTYDTAKDAEIEFYKIKNDLDNYYNSSKK
jgi:hypothetical protein